MSNRDITSQMLANLLNMKREPGSLPQRMKRDIKQNDIKNLKIILIKGDGDGEVDGDGDGDEQSDEERDVEEDDGLQNPFKESLLSSDLPSELPSELMPMIYQAQAQAQAQAQEKEKEVEVEPEMIYKEQCQPQYDFINQQKDLINQQQQLIKQQQDQLKEYMTPKLVPAIITPTPTPTSTHIKKKKTVRWKELDGLISLNPKKKSRRMLRRRKLIQTRKATPIPMQPFSSNILKL